MSLDDEVSAEVASLAGLNIEALRKRWRARFGAPPCLRSGEILRRRLAEKIQVEAFGEVEGLASKLAQLARSYERSGKATAPRAAPKPGTVLFREHAGRTHKVEVAADGYRWEGRAYRSLSRIAREITGVQWSGPAFFGLPARRTA